MAQVTAYQSSKMYIQNIMNKYLQIRMKCTYKIVALQFVFSYTFPKVKDSGLKKLLQGFLRVTDLKWKQNM